jgi:hypothetical protein
LAMFGTHVLLRHSAWSLDLVVSAVVGALVYLAALMSFGLARAERAALKRVLGNVG